MAVSFDPKTATAGAPVSPFQMRIVAPSYAGFQYDVAPRAGSSSTLYPRTPPIR
jgi:hypothetical protein